RDLEALTLTADEILLRHFDFVHLEEAGIARQNSPLFLQRAARKTCEGAFDDEGADAVRIALLFLLEIAPGQHKGVVSDIGEQNQDLPARENIAIPLLDRDRLDAARIASRRWFGQPVG